MYSELLTPTPVIYLDQLEANIASMQDFCNQAGVQLRPHVKTHKMVEVARRQLQAGAAGLTCAKIGEAEALLPAYEGQTGNREIFIAHSIVDHHAGARLKALQEALDDVVVGCTSELHAPVLNDVAGKAGIKLPVMMAIDTGLGREGARGLEGAVRLAETISRQPNLELRGIYTHEGGFYMISPEETEAYVAKWHANLLEVHAAAEKAVGHKLLLWPGCSASARLIANLPGIDAVRPGAYMFGDIALADTVQVMTNEEVAFKILVTVVDRPIEDLALIDSGSKTLSSDRTAEGVFAKSDYGKVTRVNEEHGYLTGPGVNGLELGQRILLTPAHICPAVNLADRVAIVRGDEVIDFWNVDARGKVQ